MRTYDRRSFLARVIGGVALAAGAGAASAQSDEDGSPMLIDADPGDPARPPERPRTRGFRRTRVRPARNPEPDPASPAQPPPMTGAGSGTSTAAAPTSRFVICPGHPRCPR